MAAAAGSKPRPATTRHAGAGMTEQVAVLLLAGVEGRRKGGQDKGLLPWCGQPLYRHVLARLAPQAGWLAISANRHLDDYAASGHDVFADEAAWQGMGPLAGVAGVTPTGLQKPLPAEYASRCPAPSRSRPRRPGPSRRARARWLLAAVV